MYEAVIFDLDGTLLDTIGDLAYAMNNVLKRMGFSGHSVDTYKLLVGDGMENFVTKALPAEHRNKELIFKGIQELIKEYEESPLDKTQPFEGVELLLRELYQRGIKLAILSNKTHKLTLANVASLLPEELFELVLGARPNTPNKPDPAAAFEIAEFLNLEPSKILYLGDTNTDMKTATAAGMYPVGALWGSRTGEELLDGGAKMLLEKPIDLLDIF